jgi:hypothetical protein
LIVAPLSILADSEGEIVKIQINTISVIPQHKNNTRIPISRLRNEPFLWGQETTGLYSSLGDGSSSGMAGVLEGESV